MVLVVSSGDVISAALGAALSVLGWTAMRRDEHGGISPVSVDGAAVTARLILVADEGGVLPQIPRVARDTQWAGVIAIGGRCAVGSLLDAVERLGAAVVDGDQPLPQLIASLDRELRRGSGPDASGSDHSMLRLRVNEAGRLARLTHRELDVLGAMMRGESAAEIAAARFLSIATVRAHIRAVLRKLEVPSQLAAVALAYRSHCRRGDAAP
jgi:DNA-binding CsgD family transcriptional regulator